MVEPDPVVWDSARVNAASTRLLAACEAVVKRYDYLFEDMDPDYAAFFTAMTDVVDQARDAIDLAIGPEGGA